MKFLKRLILVPLVLLAMWALWPDGGGESSSSASTTSGGGGGDPLRKVSGSRDAKYVIRFNPGPLYLPGTLPENGQQPVEGMLRVGDEFTRKFPDTRIEFVGVPGGQREWLVTQLSSGQAPDVIQINARETWQDTQRGWYAPLDRYLDEPNPFIPPGHPGSARWWDVFEYPVPMYGTKAPDGHLYCVTLDMIETGIFYNKDIFARLGLNVPKDWVEFIEVQKKLKEAGYIPMLVERNCVTDWAVDLIFDQLYHNLRGLMDLNFDPRRGEDMNGYLDWDELIFLHRQGFFSAKDARWRELWRLLKEWRQYMAQDLNYTGVDFTKSFLTQKGAMYWSTSMEVNRIVQDPERGFDWGLFYVPGIPSSVSRFAHGREMCVISGCAMQYSMTNSAFRDTGNPDTSERIKRVVAFLQYLTTPASCDQVVNEQIALLPNIKGVPPRQQLEQFRAIRQRHYSMTKWFYTFDLQFDEVMLRMLELYLNDGISEDQFIGWMERNLDTAAERITVRKKLDFAPLQKVWDSRKEMRKQFTELPDGAN